MRTVILYLFKGYDLIINAYSVSYVIMRSNGINTTERMWKERILPDEQQKAMDYNFDIRSFNYRNIFSGSKDYSG